ncbi:DUF3226 domain-containing protein [Tenacibaculum finnmarkense]|uniref:DUF3226 domain-containing protein n=1 Tax=Tenacibaculum finnmarkense TaxID=2781243 RepID=UPI00187B9006|nr:DUF3226 domain-containing protein [Tenacibaculum finnmarkense]MBE7649015.1 hypothetical protein [Tenacibaculum finnmarkense genomovar ulcerans]
MSNSEINITYVLYEGKHDAALLTRLLRENGYSNYTDKKIDDFPTSIKGFLSSKIKNFVYEDENNIYQKPQLPNAICKCKTEDKWFLFYEMGGDSKVKYVKNIIKGIAKKESGFSGEQSFETDNLASLALFFDADESLAKRKEKFTNNYTDTLSSFCKNVSVSNSYKIQSTDQDGFSKIGLYIYGADTGSGTLEDIVIPLMKKNNETVFLEANNFLENQMNAQTYSNSSKKGKALIGVVGQIEHQGKANQVIISDTKLITKGKFSADATFKEILSFFESF